MFLKFDEGLSIKDLEMAGGKGILANVADLLKYDGRKHGLRTPREKKAFTARPKIQYQSQIFR
jgi:hypothetical protein